MNEEIGTYEVNIKANQFEQGLLTFLQETSAGDMEELCKDVGINKDTLNFYNIAALQAYRDSVSSAPSDPNFNYL
jgi:hypothetical protein